MGQEARTQPGHSRLGRAPGAQGPAHPGHWVSCWPHLPADCQSLWVEALLPSPVPQQIQRCKPWGAVLGAASQSPAHAPTIQVTEHFPECFLTLATHEKHIGGIFKIQMTGPSQDLLEQNFQKWFLNRCTLGNRHRGL